MKLSWSLVSAVLLLLCASNHSVQTDDYVEGFDWHADDPLLYEDIVVEGVLQSIAFREVDRELIDSSSPTPKIWIGALELEDIHVLRGAELQLPINVWIFLQWQELVGRRVIVCARWWPALNGYLALRRNSLLIDADHGWERLDPKEVLSQEEVVSLTHKMQPVEVATRSDLIVSGQIAALEDSIVLDGKKYRGTVTKVEMNNIELVAGSYAASQIQYNTSNWVARTPKPKVGETWVAFLERRKGGWWVISGANGLLKEGEKGRLLFNGRAPLSLSKSQLIRATKEVRADGK